MQSDHFVGVSDFAKGLMELVSRLGPTQAHVIVSGETGTGKSIVARQLHDSSGKQGALQVFDCSAVPSELMACSLFGSRRGAFTGAISSVGVAEQAEGGTLWIEEIGVMPIQLQPIFLRLLDGFYRPLGAPSDHAFSARVIATTNRDLKQLVAEGRFLQDLYFRLNRASVVIPPLRERQEDLLPLLEYFVANSEFNLNQTVKLSVDDTDAFSRLMRYPWPGNVREVESVVWNAMFRLQGRDTLSVRHLARCLEEMVGIDQQEAEAEAVLPAAPGLQYSRQTLKQVECDAILASLQANNWKITTTARVLGISPRTLYNRLDRYQLRRFRPGPQLVVSAE